MKKLLLRILRIIGWLFLSSVVYLVLCKWLMPPITITQIGDAIAYGGIKRSYVGWSAIPRCVKLAALASEDQRFAEHGGFDWEAMDKSLQGKQRGRRKQKVPKGAGASTISQQTAKNVFLWQGKGVFRYVRKAPEFVYTQLIEWIWGKQRILEVYLNVIEMGPGIYGIEAASQAYFHKPAKALNATEAAQIIACLPNPKRFTVKPMSRFVAHKYPKILNHSNNLSGDDDIEDLLKE
ncbi:MAG: monofunctional biosynthetic peptidoglycan transglycosylase [Chitinophagia bacterium]|nr:monofunctional biosynthetic peptidoglycan transglycosylase [Chitinophagia bacterium]